MYRFICNHSRITALFILAVGILLSLLDVTPRLHNDDMQHVFLICNGGVGDTVPYGLHNNVVFGGLNQLLMALIAGINWYLVCLLAVSLVALGVLNEFVIRRRAEAEEGPWAKSFMLIAVVILVYINWTCLQDQQIQYTHTSILAGASAALVLFDVLCGRTGWKRMAVGLFLFVAMYVLRPEALMAFVFMATASVGAWWFRGKVRRLSRRAWGFACGMLVAWGVCMVCDYVAYSQSDEWNAALTYRKQRVRIQDFPDNSGEDKSGELSAAGVKPEEYEVFKYFVYVPGMDDADKIERTRDVHVLHCRGLFGFEWAARRGLVPLTKEALVKPFTDLVQLTPWFPLVFLAGFYVWVADRKSARVILPALCATGGYICLLILSGRCSGRVLYPALFFADAWVLSFLSADARMGKWRVVRWGAVGAALLCFAVCMRHYRVHMGPTAHTAADICRAHPENIYLATTWQAGSAYYSGITGCTREAIRQTNVIPIADAWIFYTPAYRAFLRQRGITNPYLLLLEPHVYVLVKDYDGVHEPSILQPIKTAYALSTNGGKLEFQHRQTHGAISFWQAVPAVENANQ